MFLAVDVGNTNITLGIMNGDDVVHECRLRTQLKSTADEMAIMLRLLDGIADVPRAEWTGAAICSVAPAINRPLAQAIHRAIGIQPLVLSPDMDLGIANKYEHPMQVGMDRLANAVAGIETYGPAIVIADLGTATTLDIVSREGEYLGGVILPGIEATADALHSRTSKLPLLTLDSIERPKGAIGRTTVQAMLAGLYFGSIDAIEGGVARIEAELGHPMRLVGTGGLARRLAPDMKRMQHVDDTLTLRGTLRIWQRNASRRAG